MTAPAPPPSTGARGGRRAWAALAIGTVLVLVLVLVVVLVTRSDERQATEQAAEEVHFQSPSGLAVVPGEDGSDRPEIVGLITTTGDDGTDVDIVRAAIDGSITWRNGTIVDDIGTDAEVVTVVEDMVLVIVDDELVALDLGTGSEEWRRPFDVARETCAGCISMVGSTLVAISRRGAVWGLNPSTGEEIWSRHPAGAAQVYVAPVVAGDAVVVAEEADDGIDLVILDAATGDERDRFQPRCTPTAETREEGVGLGVTVEAVPDSTDVVVAFGHEATCAQRWTTERPAPTWQTVVDEVGYYGGTLESVVDDAHLAVAGQDGFVVAFDIATGAATTLADPGGGVSVAPAALSGDVVVAVTSTEDGGWTGLLTGDLDEGEAVGPRLAFDPGVGFVRADEVAGRVGATEDHDVEILATTPGGIVLVTLPATGPGPRTLPISSIDPDTGERVEGPTAMLEQDPDAVTNGLDWFHTVVDGRAVVTVGGLPQLVDLETGEVVASWPLPG
ncbi:MAG TPA: PQQ-binding-like beta-propeller repeat protein [Iamia sp.]